MQNMMGMRSRGAERGSDIVARETQIAQANTTLRQADAQINEIQAALRDTKSVAPFAGVIETLYVEVGDTVQPGQPLLNFSETTGFQVLADVPVRLRPGLREGMPLWVRLDGRPPALAAPISRIFPVADPEQHTVRVELDLPPEAIATVGQYAEVAVPDSGAHRAAQLILPRSAIVTKGGLPLVYTLGPDGRTRLRVVRLGEPLADGMVAVLSGVREGDQVVDNPPPGLRAGTQVLPTANAVKPNNNH
jgi:RND family efflux transporter MFP subunit